MLFKKEILDLRLKKYAVKLDVVYLGKNTHTLLESKWKESPEEDQSVEWPKYNKKAKKKKKTNKLIWK